MCLKVEKLKSLKANPSTVQLFNHYSTHDSQLTKDTTHEKERGEMNTIEIMVAIAGLFLTVVGQGLYLAYKLGKFEEKLVNIEKKQDKHNDVINRTYRLESRTDVQEEQIKVINHRIEDLEHANN